MVRLLKHIAGTLPLLTILAVAMGVGLVDRPVSAADDMAEPVKAARAEGIVIVHGPPGRTYEGALTKAFEAAHPGVRVEYSGANNRTAVPKLFREREAGIYLWDVWMGGPATLLSQLMPRGVLQPLPPILLAETTDNSKWIHGFDDGWMDNEKKFVYAFDAGLQETAWINWDFVSRDEVKSVQDVLKPKFSGKIVFDEPRRGGSGNGTSLGLLLNYGDDFLRKLYAQNIIVTDNRRQVAEWLIRGRYPIAFGTSPTEFKMFQDQGLGENLTPVPLGKGEKIQMTPGFGSVSLVERPPHPNAAKLYINWLLSTDGQKQWTSAARTSRRLDAPCDAYCQQGRATLAQAGENYFKGQHEDAIAKREEAAKIAKEVIKAPLPAGSDD